MTDSGRPSPAPSKREFSWKEYITTEGTWLPSPQHCRATRMLTSYTTGLDEIVAHLQAAAEGLERPMFVDYDPAEGEEWYGPGVSGFRLCTAEEHTGAERLARALREREVAELARLKEKYEAS